MPCAGGGGSVNGIVLVGPPPSGVIETEGWGSPPGAAGGFTGAVGCGLGGCFSSTVRVLVPAPRVARMASDREVSINSDAAMVVAFDSTVAEPRGPKAVCEPMPPKAPARSAALPLWSNTTITRKKETTM